MKASTIALLALAFLVLRENRGTGNPFAGLLGTAHAADLPPEAPTGPGNAIDEVTAYVNSTTGLVDSLGNLGRETAGVVGGIWDMFNHKESGNGPDPQAEAPSSIFA